MFLYRILYECIYKINKCIRPHVCSVGQCVFLVSFTFCLQFSGEMRTYLFITNSTIQYGSNGTSNSFLIFIMIELFYWNLFTLNILWRNIKQPISYFHIRKWFFLKMRCSIPYTLHFWFTVLNACWWGMHLLTSQFTYPLIWIFTKRIWMKIIFINQIYYLLQSYFLLEKFYEQISKKALMSIIAVLFNMHLSGKIIVIHWHIK